MRKSIHFSLLLTLLLLSPLDHSTTPISTALYQGDKVEATGFIVALKTPNNLCSGALVGERVVVTALGCVLNPGGNLINPLNAIDIFTPDANLLSAKPAAKVVEYFTPATNLQSLFPNIAFLVLDKKIGKSPIAEMATYDNASQLAAASEIFDVFGYGITSDRVGSPIGDLPRKTKAFPNFKKDPYENQKDYFRFSPAICYGDVGAPVITKVNGKLILIGVAFSIQGSDGKCDGSGGSSVTPKITFATIAGEYSTLFSRVLRLVQELDKKEADIEAAAKAIEEAQAKAKQVAQEAEEAKCVANRAELVSIGLQLEQAIGDYPNQATLFSSIYAKLINTMSDKCVSQIAVLNFKTEATMAISKSEQASKKRMIICSKGKTIKKVSGLKPKCPKGFKEKQS